MKSKFLSLIFLSLLLKILSLIAEYNLVLIILFLLSTLDTIFFYFYAKLVFFKVKLTDLFILTSIVFYFYTNAPIILYLLAPESISFTIEILIKYALISTLYLNFFQAFIFLLIKRTTLNQYDNYFSEFICSSSHKKNSLFLVALIGSLMTAYYIFNYNQSGISQLMSNSSRLEKTIAIESGKIWLIQYAFSAWTMSVIILFLKNEKKLKIINFIFIINIFIYHIYYFSIGNRREFVAILIFIFYLLLIKKYKYIVYIVAFASFLFLLYLGYHRNGIDGSSAFNNLSITLGEFIFPNYPLLTFLSIDIHYHFGLTYIEKLATHIPSFNLWTPPKSLAKEFIDFYTNGTMGYAYTPLAEGYKNFGFFSVVIVPFMMVLLINFFLKRKYIILGLLPFVLVFDVSRGESSSLLIQFLIYVVFIKSFVYLGSIKIA